MPTVNVKPELIRWAINRSGLSTDELREKFPKLGDWESGDRLPTFRQLQEFARKTMTPFGMLLLDEPPREELAVPDFRTVGDTPIRRASPNLIDTIQETQRRQAFMRDLRLEEGFDELGFVGVAKEFRNVKSLAQKIRQELDLSADWAESLPTWEDALIALRRAIEGAGILVFSNSVVGLNNHRPLEPEEFRGFVLCDRIAPTIFVNDADSKSARMFTLAHELAHIWVGRDGLFNLIDMLPYNDATERFCNRVAAEFLIPQYKLEARWKEAKSKPNPFATIARWFKVSPVVAARRALDLKLITKQAFFDFYHKDRDDFLRRKRADKKKKGGGNFYATQAVRLGRPFSNAVVRAAREGRILYRDAYRLTGLRGETFGRYADVILERMKNERQ